MSLIAGSLILSSLLEEIGLKTALLWGNLPAPK
jgi:hypothetical protein